MKNSKKKRQPYSERSDIEKIKTNWQKTKGLYEREEWSGSIIRAATAFEIAANLVIREELQLRKDLDKDFVDNLLLWANGIYGKFKWLILPISKGSPKYEIFRSAMTKVNEINKERNSIVHSGQFKKESTTKHIIDLSKEVIETLVQQYSAEFNLRNIDY